MKLFAERLRSRRIEMGVTQQWVADRMQVDRSTYAKYELDRVEPPLEGLRHLAEVLDCSTDWLLGRE